MMIAPFKQLPRPDAVLLVAFIALCLPPLLFIFRFLDDNTLTSWRWIFTPERQSAAFGLLVAAIVFSFWLSRLPIGERHYQPVLFLGAFLSAFLFWPEPEVILDAARYFLQAKCLSSYGPAYFFREWGKAIPAWSDLPLVPFAYGIVFKLAGESRLAIQTFTTLLFALSAVCTFRIGKTLWDGETGFLAGLLLLASPYLLIQVPLMLVDVPLLFLFTLALYAFLNAVERGGPARLVFAVLSIVLALLSKYSAGPMLLVLPIVTLVSVTKGNPDALGRSGLVFGCVALLVAGFFFEKADIVQGQIELLRNYQWPGLGRWKEGLLSTFLFQIHPFVAAAAMFGTYGAIRHRDLTFIIPAWFALFMLLFQVERIRYLLPLFPLLALMAGYGLRTLFSERRVRRFTALCAVTSALAVALACYLPFLNATSMSNLRDAGRYLDTLQTNEIRVSILPQKRSMGNSETAIPLLDFYTGKRIVYDARGPVPPSDDSALHTAPLRFTWNMPLPGFYYTAEGPSPGSPAVIISGDRNDAVHVSERAGTRHFTKDTETFRYRTFVTVRSGAGLSGSAQ